MRRLSVVLVILSLLLGGLWMPTPVRADDALCLTETTPGCTHGLPTGVYERLLAEMQAHPAPDVAPVPINTKEVGAYSFYRVLPDTKLYDAPNGNVIGQIDNGFNYVSVYKVQDGFAQLRDKSWVRRDALKHTYASTFSGVLIGKPLLYPIAWVIQASLPSSVPGGIRDPKTPAIRRYTRVNIFATVQVGGWDWYLVGPGQWLEQRKVARVIPAARPEGSAKWAAVDLYEQVLSVYDGDTLIAATLISSGLPAWQTKQGTFKVWKRVALTAMSGAMGQPDFYSLPAVPFVMYFDNEISLHGTYWHDGFGFKHSHGCVNMSIGDAHWLYDWVGDPADLTVLVWGSHAD